jgi:hypothetical protein
MKKIWIAIILMLGVLFVVNWFTYTHPVETIPQAEQMKILSELRSRYADDCECTDKGDSWHCRENKTNRLFIVRK